MSILMNGQLYIKKYPEIFYVDEDTINMNFDEMIVDREDPEIDELMELRDSIIAQDGTIDYSGMSGFWISIIEEDKIKMVCLAEEQLDFPKVIYYDNEKGLEEDFISLIDFLDKGKYIGQKFRTLNENLKGSKLSYFSDDLRPLVLYEYNELFLVLYNKSRYEMMSPFFTKDGDYEIYGKVVDGYKDKPAIYQEIFKQVSDKCRGRRDR
ncbi:MAG: hypothetical protein K6G37_00855 [Bacilli bacterium]|nr:hypothetical protein [Bacilli bacterium]